MTIDKDVWAGLFFAVLGALGLWFGADYAFGTPAKMGAGFLPKILSWCLVGFGGIIMLVGFMRRAEPMEEWAWGQVMAILCSVLVFGALLEPAGLEASILGAVLVGALSVPTPNRFEHWLVVVASIALSLVLFPGAPAKLGGTTPLWIVTGLALVPAIVSHARHLTLVQIAERLLVIVVLAVACVIIFSDLLGLTIKSAVVLDLWIPVKNVLFAPLGRLVRSLFGA